MYIYIQIFFPSYRFFHWRFSLKLSNINLFIENAIEKYIGQRLSRKKETKHQPNVVIHNFENSEIHQIASEILNILKKSSIKLIKKRKETTQIALKNPRLASLSFGQIKKKTTIEQIEDMSAKHSFLLITCAM